MCVCGGGVLSTKTHSILNLLLIHCHQAMVNWLGSKRSAVDIALLDLARSTVCTILNSIPLLLPLVLFCIRLVRSSGILHHHLNSFLL